MQDELVSFTQTSIVGFSVSADTDDIAETVTPKRPAGPSVVTMLTVAAAWLMPARNFCFSSRSSALATGIDFLATHLSPGVCG